MISFLSKLSFWMFWMLSACLIGAGVGWYIENL